MDDKYRSRKFALTLTAFSVASLFCVYGLIGSGEWVTITTLMLTIYGTANVLEKKQ